MALTNEDLQALSDIIDKKLDEKLKPINQRLDKMDDRLDKMDDRLDKMDDRLDKMEVWQKKTSEQVADLQVAQKLFELNTNKKLARLQDGMDTVEEILKLNDLIPR